MKIHKFQNATTNTYKDIIVALSTFVMYQRNSIATIKRASQRHHNKDKTFEPEIYEQAGK